MPISISTLGFRAEETAGKIAGSGEDGAAATRALDRFFDTQLGHWVPFAVAFLLVIGVMRGLQIILLRDPGISPERRLPRQITMYVLALLSLLTLIVALPQDDKGLITDELKVSLISLVGLAIAALLTLSSTTLAANAMAGFMHRSVKSWRVGDFIRVGEYFGRVSERGLFHTEIQTEDRDLVTLPNMFLATNPVRVVR